MNPNLLDPRAASRNFNHRQRQRALQREQTIESIELPEAGGTNVPLARVSCGNYFGSIPRFRELENLERFVHGWDL